MAINDRCNYLPYSLSLSFFPVLKHPGRNKTVANSLRPSPPHLGLPAKLQIPESRYAKRKRQAQTGLPWRIKAISGSPEDWKQTCKSFSLYLPLKGIHWLVNLQKTSHPNLERTWTARGVTLLIWHVLERRELPTNTVGFGYMFLFPTGLYGVTQFQCIQLIQIPSYENTI